MTTKLLRLWAEFFGVGDSKNGFFFPTYQQIQKIYSVQEKENPKNHVQINSTNLGVTEVIYPEVWKIRKIMKEGKDKEIPKDQENEKKNT